MSLCHRKIALRFTLHLKVLLSLYQLSYSQVISDEEELERRELAAWMPGYLAATFADSMKEFAQKKADYEFSPEARTESQQRNNMKTKSFSYTSIRLQTSEPDQARQIPASGVAPQMHSQEGAEVAAVQTTSKASSVETPPVTLTTAQMEQWQQFLEWQQWQQQMQLVQKKPEDASGFDQNPVQRAPATLQNVGYAPQGVPFENG